MAFGCLTYMVISLWEINSGRKEYCTSLCGRWAPWRWSLVQRDSRGVPVQSQRSSACFAAGDRARCAALEHLFRLCAIHADAEPIERQSAIVRRYAVTGEGQVHVLLDRISKRKSCSSAELRKLRGRNSDARPASHSRRGLCRFITTSKLWIRRAWSASAKLLRRSEKGAWRKARRVIGDPQTPLPNELDRIEQTLRHRRGAHGAAGAGTLAGAAM